MIFNLDICPFFYSKGADLTFNQINLQDSNFKPTMICNFDSLQWQNHRNRTFLSSKSFSKMNNIDFWHSIVKIQYISNHLKPKNLKECKIGHSWINDQNRQFIALWIGLLQIKLRNMF